MGPTRGGEAPSLGLAATHVETGRPPSSRPITQPLTAAGPLLAHIGRFTVLECLGEGGMGIVYAAYDEQLDRKVAVKVLRGETMRRDPQARDRMLREAQAMARVSHPNIVTVHDVDKHHGEIFIAMEFVRGQNLGAWLNAAPRTWREVVAALIQAGRGLAAAHAAGLIHRDFKPANVLVGSDGVIKVLDFGLARAVDSPVEPAAPLRMSISTSLDADLTRTGAVLGTPAYMAPEQHLGEPATEKSDQFSFCVSLYEALYGQPPFDGTSLLALTYAVTQGRVRDPPPGSAVPAAVLQIVMRGLSVDPSKRFASMPALLAALERTLERRKIPWFVGVGVAAMIGVAGFTAASLRPGEDACAAAAGELVGLWDAGTAEAVHGGLLATGVPFAEDTWTRVRPRLDAYAQALSSMRVDACRAHEEGRSSMRLFDMRTACLDQRRTSLATFVTILKQADVEVVGNAAAAAAAPPAARGPGAPPGPPRRAAPPPGAGAAAPVADVRAVLAEAQAHESAGQATRGLELVEALDLAGLDYKPALAEVALRRGSLLSEVGRHPEADAELTRGLGPALASGHDIVAATIATRRDFVRAARLQHAREVLAEAPAVAGLVERIERYEQGMALRGDHLNNLGIAHAMLGHQQDAERHFAESIDVRTAALGADDPQVVYALGNLGLTLLQGDDFAEATRRLRSAFLAAESSLGPKHPHVALLAINLGTGHLALGQVRDAAADFQRALALQTELLGADAPDLQYVLLALGDLGLEQRQCGEAAESYQRALRLLGQDVETGDPSALPAIIGLARAATCAGDFATALPHFDRALALAEKTLGADELRLAGFVDYRGDMHLKSGDTALALADYQRALAIRQRQLPAGAADLGESYRRIGGVHRRLRQVQEAAAALQRAQQLQETGALADSVAAGQIRLRLGELALDLNEPTQARAHFERAAGIYSANSDPDTLELALARFGLARALTAQSGAITPEARGLADQALAALGGRGPAFAPEAKAVRAWLGPRGR